MGVKNNSAGLGLDSDFRLILRGVSPGELRPAEQRNNNVRIAEPTDTGIPPAGSTQEGPPGFCKCRYAYTTFGKNGFQGGAFNFGSWPLSDKTVYQDLAGGWR